VIESTFSESPLLCGGLKMSGRPWSTTHSDIDERTARSSGSPSRVPRRARSVSSPEAASRSTT